MTDQELERVLKETLPPAALADADDATLEALLDGQDSADPAYGQGMLARAQQPTPNAKPKSNTWLLAIAALLLLAAIPVALIAIANKPSTGNGETANNPTSNDRGLVDITPNFPEPAFHGTPLDIKLPNLEPARSPRLTFTAPDGVHLISHNAKVTSSEPAPLFGKLEMVTDGVKTGDDEHFVELPPGHQWIQIDLGQSRKIFAITLWLYHKQMRAYRDVVIQASTDAGFSAEATIVYNNDHDNSLGFGTGEDAAYIETHHGRIIDIEGVEARYIRLHSNGNTTDELNHYTEVEVYGQ